MGIVALALSGCALSGCGVKYSASPNPTSPQANPGTNAADCKPGTKKPKIDIASIKGKQLEEAKSIALNHGYTIRATFIDGQPQAATMDYSEHRLNVAVQNGVVTQFCGVG